jgi:Rieske Fe-S protein
MMDSNDVATKPRRSFLSYLLGGTLASVLAPVAYVVARYLRIPDRLPVTVLVGPVSSIPSGTSRFVKVGMADGILFHHEDGTFEAFNLRCTHAGCNVAWQGNAERFYCPCHGGVFDREGNVVEGPPKRGLDRLEVTIVKGTVQVTRG